MPQALRSASSSPRSIRGSLARHGPGRLAGRDFRRSPGDQPQRRRHYHLHIRSARWHQSEAAAQATTSATPGPNQFSIGATPAATAANLQAALTAGISQIGSTALSAASAIAASNDFFDDPPQRVSGSPFTATAMVDGTPADTVFWYTGEDGPGSARSTATARIDPTTTVSYGTRANEQGIRWIVQNIAALAATSYSTSDPNAAASYAALNQRAMRRSAFRRASKAPTISRAVSPARRRRWLRRKASTNRRQTF